ncbi:MAG: hypothetical protein KKG33_06925 [candidate division Zixibacteria bacterium]|nr:hypothetical protein [candidate division Zixibacteria bacterium]MBU2625275.1 hypothetical protein [candidate division Zixibacteria bacterium]
MGNMYIIGISELNAPVLLGPPFSTDFGRGVDLDVSESKVYMVQGTHHGPLLVVNVSNPQVPTKESVRGHSGQAKGVVIVDTLAFVATGYTGLQIINLALSPEVLWWDGRTGAPGLTSWDVAVQGSFAYLAADEDGIIIVDVTKPAKPQIVDSCDMPGEARQIVIEAGYAYVTAYWGRDLQILSLENPTKPVFVSHFRAEESGAINRVDVSGDLVFCAGARGVSVLYIADRSDPNLVGRYNTDGECSDVAVHDDNVLVVGEFGLIVLKVSF